MVLGVRQLRKFIAWGYAESYKGMQGGTQMKKVENPWSRLDRTSGSFSLEN